MTNQYEVTVTDNGSFELPDAGLHNAVCIFVADIGAQTTRWGTSEKVMLGFELEGGANIYQEYTKSLNEKSNLRKTIESWRGAKFGKEELQGFGLSKLVGVSCTINVVHSDDGKYANIGTIMPKQKVLEPTQTPFLFTVQDPNLTHLSELPKWIQKKVTGESDSPQENALQQPQQSAPAQPTQTAAPRTNVQQLEF